MFVLRSVVCTLLLVGVSGCGVVAPDDDVIRGSGNETYVYGCDVDEEPTIDIDLTALGFSPSCETAFADDFLAMEVSPKPIPGAVESYAIVFGPGIDLLIRQWVDFEERDDNEVWVKLPVRPGRRAPQRIWAMGGECGAGCVDIAYLPVLTEPECGITYDAVVTAADCPQ